MSKLLLRQEFHLEMTQAKQYFAKQNYRLAFSHLELAHILGQRSTRSHCISHYWMLKVGLKQGNKKAILGQIARIVAALLFSRIWVPVGNTGGTNVSPVKAMPIPEQLKDFFD